VEQEKLTSSIPQLQARSIPSGRHRANRIETDWGQPLEITRKIANIGIVRGRLLNDKAVKAISGTHPMRNKYVAGILLFTTFFLISSSVSSQADPITYTEITEDTDFSALTNPNSGIVIDTSTVVILNNAFVFPDFDLNFDPDQVFTYNPSPFPPGFNPCEEGGPFYPVDPSDLLNPCAPGGPFNPSNLTPTSSQISNPEDYVLSSSGILLQAGGSTSDSSTGRAALTALIQDSENAAQFPNLPVVTNLSSLEFSFSTQPGANSVTLDFILASGEHFQGDWDIAGIFIDGTNYAFLSNGRLLRVNQSAQISNVCNTGTPEGCQQSDYVINQEILGTISPRLTLFAPIDPFLSTHTFMAAVANTNDNILPSSLLISNFQAFGASQAFVSTFDAGIQFGDEFSLALEEIISNPDFGLVVIQISIPEPLQISIPDPLQKSKITSSSITAADSNNDYVKITLKGEFPEAVRNIDVNGRRVSVDSWQQDSSTITVTVPAVGSGSYVVNVWNGSAPVLPSEIVIATSK
jgi:hypothetical protein